MSEIQNEGAVDCRPSAVVDYPLPKPVLNTNGKERVINLFNPQIQQYPNHNQAHSKVRHQIESLSK